MPTMEQELNLDALMFMLKGEPAMRKSTQALSFPKPQYWFSFDQKMESLYIPMLKWKVKPSDVHFDNYTDWQKPLKKLEELQLNCKYKTIVVDSVTTCTQAIMRQSRKLKVGTTKADGKKEAGMRVAGIPVNELEDYKAEEAALNELVALVMDIKSFHKCNIVFIAHVLRLDQKAIDGKVNINRAIVTGAKKTASLVPALFTEVYHFASEGDMEAGKPPKFIAHTLNTGDDYARTALPLPQAISFNEMELYNGWIKPAIEEQRKAIREQLTVK